MSVRGAAETYKSTVRKPCAARQRDNTFCTIPSFYRCRHCELPLCSRHHANHYCGTGA